MPQTHRKHRVVQNEPVPPEPQREFPRVADQGHPESATPSPALSLQERLSEAWREPPLAPQTDRRWSPRATLLFGGGISLGLWAALATALAALTR